MLKYSIGCIGIWEIRFMNLRIHSSDNPFNC